MRREPITWEDVNYWLNLIGSIPVLIVIGFLLILYLIWQWLWGDY